MGTSSLHQHLSFHLHYGCMGRAYGRERFKLGPWLGSLHMWMQAEKRSVSIAPHSVASKRKVVSEFPPKGYTVSWLLCFVWKGKWPTVRPYANSGQR